jgi:hypothetical protein
MKFAHPCSAVRRGMRLACPESEFFGLRMNDDLKKIWRTRLIKDGFPDREFDIAFWQEQGDEAIFRAAWQMVVLSEEMHGRKPTFQRTVTKLKLGGS